MAGDELTTIVHADKWDDDPIGMWLDIERFKALGESDGEIIELSPERALAVGSAIVTKARAALEGKYDHHYEGDDGEEID